MDMLKKVLGAIAIVVLPTAANATEYRTVERPRQECWNEQVPVRTSGGYGGAIVGGVAGGILGNQVGGGNGKTIATAVGAATGAVVGDRMSGPGYGYQNIQRCRTVVDHVQVPVVERVRYIERPAVVERVYYVERDRDYDHYRHRKHHKRHHHHDDDD